MTGPNTKLLRNRAITLLYETNANISMAKIGALFPNNGKPLTKQTVWAIIKRHRIKRDCGNCYHSIDSFCACREEADKVTKPNKCSDWTPRKGQ